MSDASLPGPVGFLPLYKQVRAALVQRLLDRTWPPGHALPSEMELAAEIGVSQGTVRKALDEMAAERLVVRRQGRGTFVAEHDDDRILFQFFKLKADSGAQGFPESRILSVATGPAQAIEAERLHLAARAHVIRIRRIRSLETRPMLVETLALPFAIFAGLEKDAIPNNLYQLYASRFRITVAHAHEKLKAVVLKADDAHALGAPAGTPALAIDRIAIALDGKPVEWRMSYCLTGEFHYVSDLT